MGWRIPLVGVIGIGLAAMVVGAVDLAGCQQPTEDQIGEGVGNSQVCFKASTRRAAAPGRACAGRAAWLGPAATRRAPCALPLLGWPSQQAETPGVRRLVLHDFPSIASCLVKCFYPVHLQDFRSIRPAPVSALRSTKHRVPGYFRVFPCRHDADLGSLPASRAMLPHSFRVLGRCASCEPVLLATGLP
jgi:hypothetical protein